MRDTEPVVVVGAGPTGLLLAAELARHGAPVRIVDRRDGDCRESRALGVQARTLEMLDSLGLAGEFVARDARVRGFTMWDGRRRLARVEYSTLDTAFPFLLDIPQDETEAILRAHLARLGVEVEQGSEVLDLACADGHVALTARGLDEQTLTIRASYVVGCDGAHSTIRRLVGLPFDGHGYAHEWLLADVALDRDRSPDDVHIVFHASGRATVCMPLPGGRWRVILYFAGRWDAARPPALAEVAALVEERVPGPVAVSDPTWLATFQTHRRSAPAYRRGRVLLAGDAVHIHSPAGGQGMNTGLLDAHNLGWKLAAVLTSGASEALLHSYHAERAPIARDVLAPTHRLVQLTALSAPWQRAARGALVPLLAGLPPVRRQMARRISQLYAGYRTSPLCVGAVRSRHGRVRPGDRAPDAGRLVVAGRPARLHELLRGQGHVLLVVGVGAEDDAGALLCRWGGQVRRVGIDAAMDADCEVRRRFGPPALHLVRPDGHLAASGREAIEAYLGLVYGSAVQPVQAGVTSASLYELEREGTVLVRPDGHVAGRTQHASDDPPGVLRQVLGTILSGGRDRDA